MKKTALVLSGGGSRGAYEIGVWKALRELNIQIDMVFGTSVGAINGAMIVQGEPALAEKLWRRLETDMIFDLKENKEPESHDLLEQLDIHGMPATDALAYAKEIVVHGGAGASGLQSLLEQYVDESKVRASSVGYGLVATEFPSMNGCCLHLDDIPPDRLLSYILASASCFPAVQKCIIDGKKFIDGGYRDNLPVEMAMEKNASIIIAVDLQAAGVVRKHTLKEAQERTEEFHLLKSPMDLGNFLIFDKINTSRIMHLGYLETMRHWGRYDGVRYTFRKGVFSPHQLAGAEAAAFALKLDPCRIYDKDTLLDAAKIRCDALRDITEDVHILEMMKNEALRAQLVFLIAKSIRREEAESPFLQPAIFKLLEEELQAANFLIRNNVL